MTLSLIRPGTGYHSYVYRHWNIAVDVPVVPSPISDISTTIPESAGGNYTNSYLVDSFPKTLTFTPRSGSQFAYFYWTLESVTGDTGVLTGVHESFTDGIARIYQPTLVISSNTKLTISVKTSNDNTNWSTKSYFTYTIYTASAVFSENLPSSDQKAALIGTSGTPSASNKYVTDSDERVTSGLISILVNEPIVTGEQTKIITGGSVAGDKRAGTFIKVASAGLTIDNGIIFASENASYYWKRIFTDHLTPEWFGCIGDGVTNDTVKLQIALNATITWGVPLRCQADSTYLVYYTGADYNGYCLKLKHNTRLDLNGATIKLADNQWCSVLINQYWNGGGTDHIEISNGIIDGNEQGQSRVWEAPYWKRSAGGININSSPTIVMFNLDSPLFVDITIKNAFILAMCVQDCTYPHAVGISLEGSWGDGFQWSKWYDAYIEDIYAADCRGLIYQPVWGSSWGQGIIWNLYRANVGAVTLDNCRCASKIQGTSCDIVWDSLVCIAGTNTCQPISESPYYLEAWGIKFQGTAPNDHITRMKVNSILCDASDPAIDFSIQTIAMAIEVYCCDDLEIGTLTTFKSGRGVWHAPLDMKDWNTVRVFNSPRLRIGTINDHEGLGIVLCSQISLGSGTPTDTIFIGDMNVFDPQAAFLPGATGGPTLISPIDGGHLEINRIYLSESVTPPFPTRIIYGIDMETDGSESIHIGKIIKTQALSNSMFSTTADTNIARITIGQIQAGGLAGTSEGTVILNSGFKITNVSAGEISCWPTISPIISVQPINLHAADLGSMVTIPAEAPASGFNILHTTANTSDATVSWKLLGYSSLEGLTIDRKWTTLTTSGTPSARYWSTACYNSTENLTYMFGGRTGTNTALAETWTYNHITRTWTQLSPVASPSARAGSFMCYDSDRNRIVLFGGYEGGSLGETWEYYSNNWNQVITVTSPVAQATFSNGMTYDSKRKVVVMYGGSNLSTARWWEYNGTNWTEAGNALANGAFAHVGLVYNPVLEQVVAFGGSDGTEVGRCERYTWSGVLVSGLTTGGYGAEKMTMVWDSARNKIIVAGIDTGQAAAWLNATMFEIEDNLTHNLIASTLPHLRGYCAGTYCPLPEVNELMLFGGENSPCNLPGDVVNETIVYGRGNPY
jgi:hypothetical protein